MTSRTSFGPVFASIILASVFFSPGAEAKLFKTPFIKLDLPPNWSCKQEENDWVCQPDNTAERSEAIVTIVTKNLNEIDDTIPKYEAVMKAPRDMRDLMGKSYKSEIKFVRQRQIKGQTWVDGLHLGSEIPGFYTRYVASTKEQIAELVSYSIAESVYAKWSPVLDGMIDTLEITFDKNAYDDAMKGGSLLGSRGLLKGRQAPKMEGDAKPVQAKKDDSSMLIGGLMLAGVVGYLIWKRRQQRGG